MKLQHVSPALIRRCHECCHILQWLVLDGFGSARQEELCYADEAALGGKSQRRFPFHSRWRSVDIGALIQQQADDGYAAIS
ncbi:hypothetical protein PspLS_09700 [Pyricularia sp. CBS 133598]|nr:hypothetical protein PspLS_09700 [Pyricularia sp. CBS 133598]